MYKKYEELLELKGCRTADVCRETGIDPSTFSHWKKGLYLPKLEALKKIADFFDVPVSYFVDEDKDEQYHAILATNFLAQRLRDDQKALLRSAVDLTPGEVKAVDLFIKALKGETDK